MSTAVIGSAIERFDFVAHGTASAFSAQFPAEVRYSGLSFALQFGAAIGGGLAPIIATTLSTVYGNLTPVAVYVAANGRLASACAWMLLPTDSESSDGNRSFDMQKNSV